MTIDIATLRATRIDALSMRQPMRLLDDVLPWLQRAAEGRSIESLIQAFEDKGREFDGILKSARTHLQDAVPLTLGQEFSGYVAQLEHAEATIGASLGSLYPLATGGVVFEVCCSELGRVPWEVSVRPRRAY